MFYGRFDTLIRLYNKNCDKADLEIKYFSVEVCDWETQLARIQNILETWMFVQEQWLCFEPIFTTADIACQMEAEAKMFKVV